MPTPADFRLMTEATGQRIAAALEALSGTPAAAAAARQNLDVYSTSETDAAIQQSTATIHSVNSGTLELPCNAMGTQYDASHILCVVNLPFLTADTNYTVSNISATILGVGTATATLDSKSRSSIRLSVAHNGTIGTAYIVFVYLTITF